MIATLLLFVAPFAAPVSAASPQEVEDERADLAERLDAFEDHLKARGAEDTEAVALIDGFTREFEEYGPKDREAVVDALSDAFKLKRTKELEEGVPDDRVYFASAAALGRMGPESVKPLLSWLGHKKHRKNLRLQVRIVQSLGETEDERAIDPLLDLLKHKDAPLQAAGAKALARFDTVEQKVRKEIFKELLEVLMAQKAKKDADIGDLAALERWNTISGEFKATLAAMTGVDLRAAEDWQRWWNKNKKEDWDA